MLGRRVLAASSLIMAALSFIAAWLLYLFESPYFASTLELITRLSAPMALIVRALIFFANFVLVLFILSIVFERFE